MQYKKKNPYIQFDQSIEQFRLTDDEMYVTAILTKRPIYKLQNTQQTTNCIINMIKNNEIKKRQQIDIQKEQSSTTKKPFNQHFQNYDSQIFPQINNKQNHLPNFLELSKLIKLAETPRISNRIKIRSSSNDKRLNFHKSCSNRRLQINFSNIEEQFQETKNLIKKFDRIKRKKVRFDIST
ncbi:unnamed protein product [Paramecium sonneborni]|uniref:Uncharacterized protein n=1 Tax=Paramecium sonneborni TaxID=65129 RepID=A0A8S1K1K0_9CILI|nr:unnamed protein product [Paramecium sonneborni]